MKKPGRNDPCPCGSGKKFKKCCEKEMLGGRFRATKVDSESAPAVKKSTGLTSLFHQSTFSIPKKTTAGDPIPPLKKEAPNEEPEEKKEETQDTES